MTVKPLVSIIIPAYNAEQYVRETLGSALTQTYPHIEVIAVNDGSTDRTGALLRAYAAANPKLRYIEQENAGQSAARKRGLDEAKGEFVTFLDADNLLVPEACATFFEYLQSGDDVYWSDIRYFDADHPELLYRFPLHYVEDVTLARLIERNFINFLGTFIRRGAAEGCFDHGFRRADDHVIWLKLALNGARFRFIDRVLGRLRFHTTNLTFERTYLIETAETNLKMFAWLAGEISHRFEGSEQAALDAELRAQRTNWFARGALGGLMARDRARAMSMFDQLARESPHWWHFAARIMISLFPWSILVPLLMRLRKRFVMRKYERVQ